MNRLIGAAAAVLAAATATSVAIAAMPALAASHPVVAHAGKAKSAAAQHAAAAPRRAHHEPTTTAATLLPVEIASKLQGGKYVTVVRCSGTLAKAPSVHLAKPDAPLTVTGTGSSPQILKALAKPKAYKTVYTCTVTVEVKVTRSKHPVKKAGKPAAKSHPKTHKKTGCEIAASAGGGGHTGTGCTKAVTLNTGYGGLAPQVTGHHPAT